MQNRKPRKLKTIGRDQVEKNGNVLITDENGRLPLDEDVMVTHGSVVNPHDG